jgi:eukaryotic-like serine/threonine-protein kinase
VFVSPANKNLRETLVRLNLCSDRDFRRCRRIVRRLARGIPAFDFVWIDALVQTGSLTPYQAKVLQSAPPEQLCVGPCVLLERLGSSADSETYRARGPAGEIAVLKRLRMAADARPGATSALRECLDKARGLESPFVVAPHSLAEQAGAIVLLSRFVSGPSCKELLVRRGRFPADVVAEIARQVAHGCATLEARTILHGQITLANVRITNAGNTVLVDAGTGGASSKTVLIRDDVPPELYDAVAPERIGTGNPITTASDIYAFGCLVWQLLAGRPPFPTGDPLAKLAAHQSRGVPDVRTIAPDVPIPLAEAVRACTHADPEQRPASFAEIARRFGAPNPSGRQRLVRFLRRFDGAAPPDQLTLEKPARFPTVAVTLAAIVLCGATLFLLRHGATAELSRVGKDSTATAHTQTSTPKNFAAPDGPTERPRRALDGGSNALSPIPRPNADGIVELGDASYEAESLNCVGDLVIRGTGHRPATIQVRDRPLRVSCRKFSLEHVVVRREPRTPLPALVEIRAQDLTLTGCEFRAEAVSPNGSAIAWTAALSRDPDAGRIRVIDTVFATERAALMFATPPKRVEIENSLAIGGGLLEFATWSSDHDMIVVTRHLTLRRAIWLCRLASPHASVPGTLRLVLEDSAFDLKGSASALVRLTSSAEPPKARRPIVVAGRDSLIDPNVPIVAWCRPGEAAARAIDARTVAVEGLAVGEFRFVGSEQSGPAASAIELGSLTIPRQSDDPPGIVAARLASATGTPNRYLEQSAH